MSLDPDPDAMRRAGYRAVDRAVEHLARLRELPVARRVDSAAMRALVREPLPRAGEGLDASIDRFFDALLPHATLVNHPRFFAYVPGPGSFAGALGAWLAAATNLFVGTWLGGASMAQLEVEVLDWVREAAGLPRGFGGILTTGGSMANLGALAAARARLGDPGRGVVLVGAEAHYSCAKAARVLGIAEDRVWEVPLGEDRTMDPAAVVVAVGRARTEGLVPFALCATAGTTSTGAVDPLSALADLCKREDLWLHVDAAYGGAAALLPECRPLFDGLSLADSVTLDPHKWLYAPFECGCLLVRDVDALRRAFTDEADYMQDIPRDAVNFFERGPELTRGNRALPLWLLLRSVGVDAIAAAVRDDLRRCRLARDLIAEDPRFEIVTEPSLSIFTFAPRSGEADGRALLERVLADGHLMLSSTRVEGRFALRFCVVNHRTTDDDIVSSVARIRALA